MLWLTLAALVVVAVLWWRVVQEDIRQEELENRRARWGERP